MLAKVINLKAHRNFSVAAVTRYIAQDRPQQDAPELHSTDPTAVAEYIGREGVIEGGSFNLDGLSPADANDQALIIAQMDHVARAGQMRTKFSTNPFYHFVLSWREGEHPSGDQTEESIAKTLKALGMEQNQAIFAIHRDKEHHHHVHVVVNRVHPDTLALSGPPRFDYLVLDRTCREIELSQGWQHDNGPYVVIGGQVQRLSKKQRETLALLPPRADRGSAAARMQESKTGLPSLASWMKAYVAHELLDAKTWEDIHSVLARHDLRIEKLKSGLQIVGAGADGKETRTKASAVDYRLALGRLEKEMGGYRYYSATEKPNPALTYARHLENVMRGIEPAAGEVPAITGKTIERQKRRVERQDEREDLYKRYEEAKTGGKEAAKALRREISQRHAEENRSLRIKLSAMKQPRISELAREHGRQIALSIWAAERTVALNELAAAQRIEKAAATVATNLSWKAWVAREAIKGDPAAEAALRGIRYRESRKAGTKIPGFEGEDLEEHLTAAPAARGGWEQGKIGEIGGSVKALDLTRYEIDHLRQRIIYRDQDGQIALEDLGQRIECRQHQDEATIRAGLQLAAQKYGGEVFITGNDEFKARAATIAQQMRIRIANPEYQQDIIEKTQKDRNKWQER